MSQSGKKGISALISLKVVSSLIACPLALNKLLESPCSTIMKDPKGILRAMSSKAVTLPLLFDLKD